MFPFTAVDVKLIEAFDLAKPSISGLKDPYVIVAAGPNKWKSPNFNGSGTSPKFGSSITLPFEGIFRLRFTVFDYKDREVGFHDFNLGRIDPENPNFEGRVQLGNAKGRAGEVSLRLHFHTRSVQSPAKSAPPAGIPHLSPPLPFKGLRVEVGKIDDFRCNESLYLVAEYGNNTIRARPFRTKEQQKEFLTTKDFKTVFVLPFTNQRYLRVFVYESSILADKLRGSTILDLEALRTAHPFRGLFDLTSQRGKDGNLEITLSLLEAEIEAPVIHQGNEQLQVEESLQKQIAQHGYQIRSIQIYCDQIIDVPMPEGVTLLNPYVRCRIGEVYLSSEPIPKVGSTVSIGTSFRFPFHHERYVYVDVMHRKRLRQDQLLANVKVDLLPFISHIDTDSPLELPLTPTALTDRGRSDGRIRLRVLPSTAEQRTPEVKWLAGEEMKTRSRQDSLDGSEDSHSLAEELRKYQQLEVTVERVSGLLDPQEIGSMDPYVVCKLSDYELRSPVRVDAGASANILSLFIFPYLGERKLRIDVFDRDRLRSDRKIATAMVDLHALHDRQGLLDLQLTGVRGKQIGQPAGTATLKGSFLKTKCSDPHVLDLIDGKSLRPRKSSSFSSSDEEAVLGSTPFKSLDLHLSGLRRTTNETNGNYFFKVVCGPVSLKSGTIGNAKSLVISELFTMPYRGEPVLKVSRIESGLLGSKAVGTCVLRLRDLASEGTQTAPMLDSSGRPVDDLSFELAFSTTLKAPRVKSMSGGDDESSHGRTRLTKRHSYKSVFVTLTDFEGRLGRPAGLRVRMGMDGSALVTACGPKESVRFAFPWEGGRRLRIACYDKRPLTSEELLGVGKVDLEKLLEVKAEKHTMAVQLEGRSGFVTAHVKIELSQELILAPFVTRL